MPRNDLTRDSYNPPGINSDDWESFRLSDLEDNELFWLTQERVNNPAYRKLSDSSALNTKTRQNHTLSPRDLVFVKI